MEARPSGSPVRDVPRCRLQPRCSPGGTRGDAPVHHARPAPGRSDRRVAARRRREMGATGTITHIDGDRVYAFGHPFFNFGPTAFPMTRALYLRLPAQPHVVVQDRDDGRRCRDACSRIAPLRSPARWARDPTPFRCPSRSPRIARAARTFHYQVVNDQLFTPLLAYVALFNTLGNYERQFGAEPSPSRAPRQLRQARRPGVRRHLHR